MANKTTTFKINVKAEYKSLLGLTSELNKIKSNSGALGITTKESETLEHMLIAAEQLRALIDKKSDGNFGIDEQAFHALSKTFGQLTTKAQNFSKALVKVLKPDVQDEISKIDTKIAELQAANKDSGRAKGRATAKINREKNTAAVQASQKFGAVDLEGNAFKTYEDLSQAAANLEKLNRDLDDRERAIVQAWQQAQQTILPFVQQYEQAWNEADAAIDANRKSIAELQQEKNRILEGGDIAPELAPESKQAIQDYSRVLDSMNNSLEDSHNQLAQYKKEQSDATNKQKKHNKALSDGSKTTKNYSTTLGKAVYNVVSYGSALTLVRTISNKFIQTITEMDKALTSMTVVTQLSREQAWQLTGQLQDLANQTGMTTTEVAQMTTMYLQQGETLSNALTLTETAAKAARIAGISGSESINLLTNAMNGFQMSASQAAEVSDKFAALAAEAATDYEELATALSKVAAQANLAGMSMDFTLGLLTKGIEVTREAPETIGTALKTVISRMRELTDYGETLEDGVDVNRVDTALQNIGVSLLDTNREFRDLEDVLTEVGQKWDTLNTNQQANVAVALAGTRQQSRLIAMMQDFDRTQELVNISMNSAGATAAQHRKYMEGLEAATTALTTSYQKLITNFMNSDIAIGVINGLSTAIGFLGDNIGLVYAVVGALLIPFGSLVKTKIVDLALTLAGTIANVAYGKSIDEVTEKEIEGLKINEHKYGSFVKWISVRAAGIITNLAYGKTLSSEDKQIKQNIISQGIYNQVMNANPVMLILTVVLALVAAWWALNKETEAGIRFQQTLSTLMSSLGTLLTEILNLLVPILEFVMLIVNTVMRIVIPILEIVINVVSAIVNIISGIIAVIADGLKWVKELIGSSKILTAYFDWITGKTFLKILGQFTEVIGKWTKSIAEWFETPAEKSKRLSEEIAANQEKIYDAQQKSSTLKPLIEEYEQLNAKTSKTAEELERIKEIESEIGDIDKSYLNSDGTIKIDLVNTVILEAEGVAKSLLEEDLNKGIEGLTTGEITQEMISGITDYYRQQAVEIAGINATTAANIANNYERIVGNIKKENLATMTKEDFDALYESVKDLQIQLEDAGEDNTLIKQFEKYEEKIANLPDAAKEAFNAMYSAYASYANMINELSLTGEARTNFLSKIASLGITDIEYQNIMSEYMEKTGADQEQFEEWFANAVNSGQNRSEILRAMMSGIIGRDLGKNGTLTSAEIEEYQGLLNTISSSMLKTNQAATEDYIKSESKASNLAELSKKAAAGTITNEEWRTLQAEHPDLLTDANKYQQFIKGLYTGADIIAEAKQTYEEELKAQLDYAKAINDISQVKMLELQLDNLKYSHLYSTEIWKNYANQTKEQQKQIRLNQTLKKLEEQLSDLNEEDEDYSQKKLDILRQQEAVYRAQLADAKALLTDPRYLKAREYLSIVNGEVIFDSAKAKENVESADFDWLDSNIEALKEAYKLQEEANKNTKALLDEYRSIAEAQYEKEKEMIEERKTSYEDYFDALDALEEEQERKESRDNIVRQLASLSGGIGGNTKTLQKELMQQLQELNEEEEEARKQAARDALIEDMDNHIENIDKNIGNLKSLSEEELKSLLTSMGLEVKGYDVTNNTDADGGFTVVPKYKEGGYVDFTGPAWVDGTKDRPEAFLDATDTALLRNILDTILGNFEFPKYESTEEDEEEWIQSIIIENIDIHTDKLNNNQDFASAGNTLAKELAKIIRERGLNVNAKK